MFSGAKYCILIFIAAAGCILFVILGLRITTSATPTTTSTPTTSTGRLLGDEREREKVNVFNFS